MNAFKLAAENNLSVRTTHVGRDDKRKQLVVTVSVSVGKQGEMLRENVHYYIVDDVANNQVNAVLRDAETAAIIQYLGLGIAVPIEEEPAKEEEPVKEEPKEEDAVEKPAKRTRKKSAKKAAKKAAAKKPEPAPEPEPVVEPEIDTDEDLAGDDESEVETVLYDRTDKGHQAALKPLIIECFDADWKSDAGIKKQVRDLIVNKLHGKVAVTDMDGNLLPSFRETVLTLLD